MNKKYKINYYNLIPIQIQNHYLTELNECLETDKNLYHFIKRLCSLYTFDFFIALLNKCVIYKEYYNKGYCDLVFLAFLKANHNSEIDIDIFRVFLFYIKKQLDLDKNKYTDGTVIEYQNVVYGLDVFNLIEKDFNTQLKIKSDKTYVKIKKDERLKIDEVIKQQSINTIDAIQETQNNYSFFNVFSQEEAINHNKEISLLEKMPYLKDMKYCLYSADSEFSIASNILLKQFLYLIEHNLNEYKDITLYDVDDYLFDYNFTKIILADVDFILNYLALHYFIYGNETKETSLIKHLKSLLKFIINDNDDIKNVMITIKKHQEYLFEYNVLDKLQSELNSIEKFNNEQKQKSKLRIVK